MTAVCSGVSLITVTVKLAATTVDSEGHNKGFSWSHWYAAATMTAVPNAFSGIYHMSFSKVEPPTNFLWYVLVSVMVFALGFPVPIWLLCSPTGAQQLAFTTPQPFTGICASWWWSVAQARSARSSCSYHYLQYGGALYHSFSCSPDIPAIWWAI